MFLQLLRVLQDQICQAGIIPSVSQKRLDRPVEFQRFLVFFLMKKDMLEKLAIVPAKSADLYLGVKPLPSTVSRLPIS